MLRIVGDAKETDGFREAALRLPTPFASIRTLSPRQAAAELLPAERAAYVCAAEKCGPPVTDPAVLRQAYDTLYPKEGTKR